MRDGGAGQERWMQGGRGWDLNLPGPRAARQTGACVSWARLGCSWSLAIIPAREGEAFVVTAAGGTAEGEPRSRSVIMDGVARQTPPFVYSSQILRDPLPAPLLLSLQLCLRP